MPQSRRPNQYQVPGLARATTRTASEGTDPRPSASTNGNGVTKDILAADSQQMISLRATGVSAESCKKEGERCQEKPNWDCCPGLYCQPASIEPFCVRIWDRVNAHKLQ